MRAVGALLALALLAGCSSDQPEPELTDGRVRGTLGGVDLVLEVADDDQERSTGLMRRESVPPGTGMVFLFDRPVDSRFYMYDVPIPLKAVFVRDGSVVEAIVMPPCEPGLSPQECPTYGPDGAYDTVVEVDPDTLPDVRPGDRFELAESR